MTINERTKLKKFNRLHAVLLIVMSLALIVGSTGCAVFGSHKLVIHPLEKDFKSVKAGEVVTVEKDGYLVSNNWISDVAGLEVEK